MNAYCVDSTSTQIARAKQRFEKRLNDAKAKGNYQDIERISADYQQEVDSILKDAQKKRDDESKASQKSGTEKAAKDKWESRFDEYVEKGDWHDVKYAEQTLLEAVTKGDAEAKSMVPVFRVAQLLAFKTPHADSFMDNQGKANFQTLTSQLNQLSKADLAKAEKFFIDRATSGKKQTHWFSNWFDFENKDPKVTEKLIGKYLPKLLPLILKECDAMVKTIVADFNGAGKFATPRACDLTFGYGIKTKELD